MNEHLKEAFSRMKPTCDMVMINPSPPNIKAFEILVSELKINVLQELQQYILFPFITHLRSKEIQTKYELQRDLVNAMKEVLQRVKIFNSSMCMKIEMSLIELIFDKSKHGMIANVPEELKLSVMQCLTALMLNLDPEVRLKLFQNQVPLLAQAVFVSVHVAKLEKLRILRVAAIESLNAHIASHKQLTDENYHITDPKLEEAIVKMTSTILPGVLAALQDVATCPDNPGHAVVVAALNSIHRIMCLTMNNKHLGNTNKLTAQDFLQMLTARASGEVRDIEKNPKDIAKLSREWYNMAGEKLKLVVSSVAPLVTHEHRRVRRELAVLCYRTIAECSETMQPSLAICVEVLVSLSSDPCTEVSSYCAAAVRDHYARCSRTDDTMDSLCDNFLLATNNLPRVLNNVDSSRKLAALNSVVGYVRVLAEAERHKPTLVVPPARLHEVVLALLAAAALDMPHNILAQHALKDASGAPPTSSPWCVMRHLEPGECTVRLRQLCASLGQLRAAPQLLQLLLLERACEALFIANWLIAGERSPPELARRMISEYLQDEVWSSPLEPAAEEPEPADTCDLSVYDPRAWTKDSVPGLYEGATEIRYTGVSYLVPVVSRARAADVRQRALRSCLLAEGMGLAARRLGQAFQPYLLRALPYMLQRVGSKYEMIHLAGLKAIYDVAIAYDYQCVVELIAYNADYLTSQISTKLKKSWSKLQALQMLTVVIEYSDECILDHLCGIVEHVLVQSCDKFHHQDLYSYLQVFLTFVSRIRDWYPAEDIPEDSEQRTEDIDVLREVLQFARNKEAAERLMEMEDSDEEGRSAEEMYREDARKREEYALDYDDAVTGESKPLPQHVTVTISIITRCINFVSSPRREDAALALRVLAEALAVLRSHEDELLPLVHRAWPPLVAAFAREPPLVRAALHLLLTLADLAKDFIRTRATKEVLPSLYKFLEKSSKESYLKDAGSAYRSSQAFALQEAILDAAPALLVRLRVDGRGLRDAMDCIQLYLSRRQPKPLQAAAVKFFKNMLVYERGATWQQLRRLCDNQLELRPPQPARAALAPVTGTPYEADPEYDDNIKLIFNVDK